MSPSRYQSVGLNSYQRPPELMPQAHRHNELEFLYVLQGELDYAFNGRPLRLPRRTLILFWSGLPHQVLRFSSQALLCGLEIPLAWYLHWKMPERLNQQLLGGRVLYESEVGASKADALLVSRWAQDLPSPRNPARKASLLEIQARLWRFASSGSGKALNPGADPGFLAEAEVSRIEQMARYIAENCRRSLRVSEVAAVVHLHPNYAMKLFRKGFGVNFNSYLNEFRVAHAQRALSTEDSKITEVGLESGFGSLSRFNSNFRRACGMSPRDYRERFGLH